MGKGLQGGMLVKLGKLGWLLVGLRRKIGEVALAVLSSVFIV